MPPLRFLRAPTILSPALVSLGIWIAVAALYALHLSALLLFSTAEATQLVLLIVVPILAVSLVCKVLYGIGAGPMSRTVVVDELSPALIEARVSQCLRIWIAAAAIETIVSGGVPLVWLATGSSKVNFDYGISSVHGMVNALLLALAATSFALFLQTGKRRLLWLPAFALLWAFILVSRGTLFVLVAECVVVFLRFRQIRWGSILRLGLLGAGLLVLFGYIGDFRSGAEAFKNLAQPTVEFPQWAPSGLLWAYIYITTPINNLLYSMHTLQPTYDLLLPHTAATLFPTVIRNFVYGKQAADAAISGGLVVEALNVSTAYVGPFQDMGRWGIIGFSLISSSLCEIYWRRDGFRNILYFSVFAQALLLSVFYNLLFSLPILGQLLWFYYFTYRQQPGWAGSPKVAQQLQQSTDALLSSESERIAPSEAPSSINFASLLKTLRRGKKTIALAGLAGLLIATAIAWLIPARYTASASFIPPTSSMSGATALAGQLSQISGLGSGLLGSVKNPGDLYVGILKSRLIAGALVKRFDLKSVYGVRKESQAEKALADHSEFTIGLKDSIVAINVTDKSAERACNMANAYMEQLQSATGGLALSESSQRRLFYEQRLAQEKNLLADAEVALKQSQEKTGLVAPAGQTTVEIEAAAQLRAQIASRQVSLASLLHDETEDNPDVLRLRRELANLQAQVSQMENGKSGGPSGSLSKAQVPGLELEYVRKARDVKYHEALFDIIAKQYEAARLDEAHDAPLQVLDHATLPDSKSGPHRLYIMLIGLLLGLLGETFRMILRPKWHSLLH